MLSIYDLLVHGVSNHLAWRCPTRKLLDLYRANLSANHLEAGVGTGYSTVQDDPVSNVSSSSTSTGTAVRARQMLAPLRPDLAPFSSVGLTYVLPCLRAE
jgi:hypothetical protein